VWDRGRAARQAEPVRIYLPSTLPLLRDVLRRGEFGAPPVTAFAVTPALREWYAEADLEELEYAAFTDGARASLRLLDADPLAPRRRVVVAAEVPDGSIEVRADLDRAVVRSALPVPNSAIVAVHVDGADAEPDVAAAARVVMESDLGGADAQFIVDGAEGHELEWYDVSEVDALLTSMLGSVADDT
jgi:hypothetical protein